MAKVYTIISILRQYFDPFHCILLLLLFCFTVSGTEGINSYSIHTLASYMVVYRILGFGVFFPTQKPASHLLYSSLAALVRHSQAQKCLQIKTHGTSVSCGPRSRRTTPVSILTGRAIMRLSCVCNFVLLVRNRTIFAVEMPSTVNTPHSKFQLNHARVWTSKNWLSFFVFFFFS